MPICPPNVAPGPGEGPKTNDTVPFIFQLGITQAAQSIDLDTLAASSYAIEVLSGVVTLGPNAVPLTVGNTYTFGIDGANGIVFLGGAGFLLDATAGEVIVWSTSGN